MVYEYDDDRNETAQVDALGHRTEWTYDDRGNPLTQTDPLGRTTSSTYDDRNGLLTQTDASGTVILANTYFSQNGNLRTSTDALGQLTEFHWDAGFGSCGTGTSEGVTDALGFRTTIQAKCDGSAFSGLPAWREDANGTRTTFTYDAMGRTQTETTTRTDEDGVVRDLVTSYAYDDAGRVIATTDPLGHVTRTEYNPIGKQSATVDALGRRTEYEYDARGNLVLTRYPDGTIETSEYDPEGNVVAQTDRAGRTTRMVYDAANRLIETILPDETPLDDSDNPRTRSEYDAAGRMIASIDERGNRTEYEYDAAGQRTATIDALGHRTEFEYDLRGNRVAMIDARGHRTEYEYDAAGRQTAVVFPDGTRSETAYDALGRRISQTDPAGQATTYEYDALGNLAAVVDALGQRTEYGYDEQSSKVLQRDALGRETRWAHDDLGRVISRTLPLGQTETYGYDAVGNRTERVDFNGAPSAFQFDVTDRLVRAEYADGQVETMTYTPTGQVDTVLDARGVTDYDYDVRDRLVRVTHPTGQVIEYAYDAAGNRVGLVTANQAVAYGFDTLNRLATVDDGRGITTYGYDEVGNRQAVEHANGTRTDYIYDDLNRLLEVTHRDPLGTPFSRQTYTLGLAGHRRQMAELDGRFVDYTYDALYRLTEERVTDPVRGDRTTAWTFDDVGNRLTETENGQVTQYAYDANDRLEQEIGPDGTIDYVYDANGNTLEKRVDGGLDTAYVYDSRDRLVRADSASATLEFGYDVNGVRQSRTENGQRTDFLVDANRDYAQVIEESGAGSDVLYLRGHDLIAQTRSGAVHTYHADGLGSTRVLSDAGGLATDGYIYTAYGELEHREGLTDSGFLFTGEQYEPRLGFYYLRARYYDPAVGRFPTMDTYQGRVGEPATLHKYLYVHGDPANNVDPSGNVSLTSFAVAGAIRLGLAVSALYAYDYYLDPTPRYHEYSISTLICSVCSVEDVFQEMLLQPAPTPLGRRSEPVQSGQVIYAGGKGLYSVMIGGFVTVSVNSSAYSHLNETLPAHLLHKGSIARYARQMGSGVVIDTFGEGTNQTAIFARLNEYWGGIFFEQLDREIAAWF
ncbi:RHS repeat protein [Wenzhouxiangella sp. XN79A]|uniref:RHS repeat protein n=1 Tax=Wenzhouxiangella sp. XN79A TaxID=2724193 RepID=UPI00144AE100|nr:RHS repeat protein [Wenzhouxiangella sp. XN79A]NKI36319.1 RHS repeat protein [Wenzhouxiangella sp. XN79A]